MSSFVARLLRNAIGDGGQTCEACQGAFDVNALSKVWLRKDSARDMTRETGRFMPIEWS
jgi:hypothetical protein